MVEFTKEENKNVHAKKKTQTNYFDYHSSLDDSTKTPVEATQKVIKLFKKNRRFFQIL